MAGITYPSAEHYMMAAKAELFGDAHTRESVLAATTPGAAKALGRQVVGFEEEIWARERMRIVVDANSGQVRTGCAPGGISSFIPVTRYWSKRARSIRSGVLGCRPTILTRTTPRAGAA